VDYGDKGQIENALVGLMNMSKEERQSLAARAKETYQKYYSTDIMKTRLIELYRELSS
jgi:hypothetical protein